MYDLQVRSVLVSAFWNKNHHYFSPFELKRSAQTSVGTPHNLDHNPEQVIGTITNSMPVTYPETLECVNGDVQHIVIDSNIEYEKIANLFNQEKATSIVGDIMGGAYSVSMECRPENFDLLLESSDKSTLTQLPVNDETSILMAFVKDFGGPGYVGDENNGGAFKIGLLLKDIKFVGVAMTKNPAGPRSKILSVRALEPKETVKASKESDLVFSLDTESIEKLTLELKKELEMADNTVKAELETKVAELEMKVTEFDTLKSSFEQLQKEADTIKASHAEALTNVEKLTASLSEMTASKTALEASVGELNAKVSALELDKKVIARQFTAYKMGLEMTDDELKVFSDEAFTVFCDKMGKVTNKTTQTPEEIEAAKKDPKVCPNCGKPMSACGGKCKKKAEDDAKLEAEKAAAEAAKLEAEKVAASKKEPPKFVADENGGLPTPEDKKNGNFNARHVLDGISGKS